MGAIIFRSKAPEHARLEQLANPEVIKPEADVAVLILHGFTAAPAGMAALVAPLVERGYSIRIPTLNGHGSHPDDLLPVHWQDWWATTRQQYNNLRANHDQVYVIGQSLGAVLCSLLFTQNPPPDKAVLLSIPWKMPGLSAKIVLPVLCTLPFAKSLVRIKLDGPDIADPNAKDNGNGYNWYPVTSANEVGKLFAYHRENIVPAPCPTLMFHSPQDHVADYAGGKKVCELLGENACLRTLERSYHVITEDYEKNIVATEIAEFFQT